MPVSRCEPSKFSEIAVGEVNRLYYISVTPGGCIPPLQGQIFHTPGEHVKSYIWLPYYRLKSWVHMNLIYIDYIDGLTRADSRFAPSQWETALLCNNVSHWLGANLESALLTQECWLQCINLLLNIHVTVVQDYRPQYFMNLHHIYYTYLSYYEHKPYKLQLD